MSHIFADAESSPLLSPTSTENTAPQAVSAAAPSSTLDMDVEHPWLGEEVPPLEHIPTPMLWRVIVKQVGIRRKIGSLYMPDQVVDSQEWIHGLGIVLKVGKACYAGPKFQAYGLTEEDRPKVGQVYRFEARQPRRFKVDGIKLVELNDDALTMHVDREHIHRIDFNV